MNTLRDLVFVMKDITRLSADVVKCQFDQLIAVYKQTLRGLLSWLLLVLAAIIIALGGLGMIVAGIHWQLARAVGPVWSGFILGGILLLLAALIFLLARNRLKD